MRIADTKQIAEWLRPVWYRPGWEFRVYEGVWEGPHLVITTVVPDAANPGETTTLDVHSMLPPIESRDQFYNWLLWRLTRIEIHEAREFFQIGSGGPWSDPHAQYAGRDENFRP